MTQRMRALMVVSWHSSSSRQQRLSRRLRQGWSRQQLLLRLQMQEQLQTGSVL
jgi:hypothetical protein